MVLELVPHFVDGVYKEERLWKRRERGEVGASGADIAWFAPNQGQGGEG